MQRSRIFRPGLATARAWLGAAMLLALAVPARAALVSGRLDFSASGFGATAPYPSVSGRVSYSFDDTAGFFNQPNGGSANGQPVQVVIDSISLPGSWTPVLSYFQFFNGQPADFFAIGHAPTTFVGAGTDDWRVAFNNTPNGPVFRELTYAVASSTNGPFMTFTGQAVPVPEPGTWALLIGGLGALVTARRVRSM